MVPNLHRAIVIVCSAKIQASPTTLPGLEGKTPKLVQEPG